MSNDPLFYSDPNEPNPLIRLDVGYCVEFWTIREAVAAGAMTPAAAAAHVRGCKQCSEYINYLKSGPAMPELPAE